MTTEDQAWVDLYWLPLGAGGHSVRFNGKVYESLASRREHRRPCDIYHSALVVHLDGVDWTVEMGPVWNVDAPTDAAACTGAVGAPWLGRFRAFRYEVRCWRGGRIPDIDEAVGGGHRLITHRGKARAVLAEVRHVPPLTWGRDEQGAGEMWNSNSVIAWVLARSGLDVSAINPPSGGRAPGWRAGIVLAARTTNAPPRASCLTRGANQKYARRRPQLDPEQHPACRGLVDLESVGSGVAVSSDDDRAGAHRRGRL